MKSELELFLALKEFVNDWDTGVHITGCSRDHSKPEGRRMSGMAGRCERVVPVYLRAKAKLMPTCDKCGQAIPLPELRTDPHQNDPNTDKRRGALQGNHEAVEQ